MTEKNKLTMKNDVIFKAFFSKKGNEKYLESFLKEIIGEEVKIKRITHDARLEQLEKEQKYGILDLDVELEDGKLINIEMQIRNNKNIEKRTTYYGSKKLISQMGIGTQYKEINKVIVIALLGYNLLEVPEYVNKTITVLEGHRNYEINNEIEYYYLELDKFRKSNPDMSKPINQWLSFIDMEKGEWLEMAKKENKEIKEAVEEYETLTGDALVKRLAEVRMLGEMEEQAALSAAKEEGQKQTRIETAEKMLKLKMPIEQIIEITELSKEEIENIKNKNSSN